ncbi:MULTISPECIES: hypothetical protein [Sulfolobaceae]|uniref:hypothetical protein n=1 Tax=Sulfolobaceae TaxID=118883 RepID=UPI00163D5780|nr:MULTISPECIES: hypothetical protein [unclassified Sulfolobus]
MKSSTVIIFLLLADTIIAYIYLKNIYFVLWSGILIAIIFLINKFILKKVEG